MSNEAFEDNDLCPNASNLGCAFDSVIYARGFHPHEIAHGVLNGRPHSVFEEGIATVLGDNGGPTSYSTDGTDIRTLMNLEDRLSFGDYRTAASFTRFFFELYPEEAMRLINTTTRPSNYTDVRAALQSSGVDLDEIVDLHAAELAQTSPNCSMDGIQVAVSECAGEPTPWQTESVWRANVSLACDEPDVLGPASNAIWTTRVVEVTERAFYRVTSEGETQTRMRLAACDRALCESVAVGNTATSLNLSGGGPWEVELIPGRYWVRALRNLDRGPDPDIAFQLEKIDPP